MNSACMESNPRMPVVGNYERQIVLDTETTGISPAHGHRIVEIGAVEIINGKESGNTFHAFLNPERAIDPAALSVHGLTEVFLSQQPRFSEIVDTFLCFIKDSELVIHNARFDIGFLDEELKRVGYGSLYQFCRGVVDTLGLARSLHYGCRNDLDSLCQRYAVSNSQRDLHGALMDAKLLAQVYQCMIV